MAFRQSSSTNKLWPFLAASLGIHLAGFGISALHKTPPQFNVMQAPPSISIAMVEEVIPPKVEPKIEPMTERSEPVLKSINANTDEPVQDKHVDISPMVVEHPQVNAPEVQVFKKYKPKVTKAKKPKQEIQKIVRKSKPEHKKVDEQTQKRSKPVQKSVMPQVNRQASSGLKSEPKPIKKFNPKPKYPKRALRRGWEGVVLLKVHVSKQGDPLEILVHNSSGRKILDDAAVRTVRKWKFEPARSGSLTFASWATIPVEFKLIEN